MSRIMLYCAAAIIIPAAGVLLNWSTDKVVALTVASTVLLITDWVMTFLIKEIVNNMYPHYSKVQIAKWNRMLARQYR